MKPVEFNIENWENLRIGNAQDDEAKTGTTVLYFPGGARVSVDVSGGGPASRESQHGNPITADNPINAVVLSGGSAYGLDAAGGVMQCMEENNIGYDTGVCLVPLVMQSDIFDLSYGRKDVRPGKEMGYAACKAALEGTDTRMGNVGAGTGATVGKMMGMERAMKSGLGIHALQIEDLVVCAVVAVNALGDIYDVKTNEKIAGLLTEDRKAFDDTYEYLYEMLAPHDMFTGNVNTTIGAIITNADFNKGELNKIAQMARNGYARSIRPVGTMADGDSIYACSTGKLKIDINVVGCLAAEAMSEAITKAVKNSKITDEEYLGNI